MLWLRIVITTALLISAVVCFAGCFACALDPEGRAQNAFVWCFFGIIVTLLGIFPTWLLFRH